jgi:hypothetical protein
MTRAPLFIGLRFTKYERLEMYSAAAKLVKQNICPDLKQKKYGLIIELKNEKQPFDLVRKTMGYSKVRTYFIGTFRFFVLFQQIRKALEELDNERLRLMPPESTDEQSLWKSAAGNYLDPFGDVLNVDDLAKHYGLKWEEVEAWTYEEALLRMLLKFRKAIVEKNFIALQKKKAKEK